MKVARLKEHMISAVAVTAKETKNIKETLNEI
jgi:hypothetical protein